MTERPELKQALGRLLGPAEPKIGCDECFEQLDRYVELELAGSGRGCRDPGLRAHLDGCPARREEHESLRALVERASSRLGSSRMRCAPASAKVRT